MTTQEKVLVMIPTYNEADNLEVVFQHISFFKLDVDYLFVDDNSPDGTGRRFAAFTALR